jgi:hypothetical protein
MHHSSYYKRRLPPVLMRAPIDWSSGEHELICREKGVHPLLGWIWNFAIRNFATKTLSYFAKLSYYFISHCRFGVLDLGLASNQIGKIICHANSVYEISQIFFRNFAEFREMIVRKFRISRNINNRLSYPPYPLYCTTLMFSRPEAPPQTMTYIYHQNLCPQLSLSLR